MTYSAKFTPLGTLHERHKQSHDFFPVGHPLVLHFLRKSLKLDDDDDVVGVARPDTERVKACDELEVRFMQEQFNYYHIQRARKNQARKIEEGEEFPVKSWLHGEWEPPRQGQGQGDGEGDGEGEGQGEARKDKKQKLIQDQDLLVRNDGQRVDLDTLDNKHVLLCFIFVPTLVSIEFFSQRLLDLALELYSTSEEKSYKDEFEIVLVVKMREGWEGSEDAYRQFVHAFPPQCLAVPFEPMSRRERLFDSAPLYEFPAAILVGPGGKVLQPGMICRFFNVYGSAQYYPFTNAVLDHASDEEIKIIEMLAYGVGFKPCPLPPYKLLSNTQVDFDLHNSLDPHMQIKMSKLVSQLEAEGKHVWLYMCVTGADLLRILVKIYELRNGDFDVVLVYSRWEADLSDFMDIINRALVKHHVSCWVLPFNNSASHRLWKLCQRPDVDKLICVEPSGRYADPYGANVFLAFGIDAYPFTRRHIIIKEYERLKKVTLNSLLFSGSQVNVFDAKNVPMLASQLTNCNIFVYFESGSTYRGRAGEIYPKEVYDKINKEEWRAKLLENFSSVQVVFVCFNEQGCGLSMESRGQMPWLVCPFNNDLLASMTRQISVMGTCPAGDGFLVSFQKNGHLCSLFADSRLKYGKNDLFDDHLREDIMFILNERYEFMEDLDPGFDFGC